MKKIWLVRVLLLMAYCVPYTFLAINGDATSGTMLFYGVMMAAFSSLCWRSIKTNNIMIVIIGNIISFLSSYIAVLSSDLEVMAWYFKPFTSQSLLVTISMVATVIQVITVVVYKVKSRNVINN